MSKKCKFTSIRYVFKHQTKFEENVIPNYPSHGFTENIIHSIHNETKRPFPQFA